MRNFGYHPGSAEVRFELADGASTDRTANAHRGETVVVRATLIPALLGNGTATARLGNETAIANFTVVGPRIAELDFRATPTAPCGPVAVRSSFWNLGTGRARDVHADLRIMDAAGLLLADFTTSIGDVAAGQLAESEGVVEEVKAVCSGDPQVYRFWLVVRAEGVTETSMTGSFVA